MAAIKKKMSKEEEIRTKTSFTRSGLTRKESREREREREK